MKIVGFHATPIAVTDPPLRNAAGLHAPYALRIVVELVTDSGVSGLSEIPGSDALFGALHAAADLVVDHDPFQLNGLYRKLQGRFGAPAADERGNKPWDQRRLVHVFSALEVACMDIIGKECGRPVADLLGGVAREQVPFAAYLFYKQEGAGGALGFATDTEATGWSAARQREALSPADIVAQAQGMVKEFGFHSIKLKGGVLPPDAEVDSVLALREAFGPDVPLRLDPNAVWKHETALAAGKRMLGVLEYYEDPVRGQEAMARLRRELDMPLATNMCTTSFEAIPESIRLGSEDIILADHHFWGGLRATVELARICRTFGRGLSMHSNSHLGISLAAMMHLGAAIPNLTYAIDTHYPWQSEEVVQGGRFQFEDGYLTVSREPGLGVALDRKALAQLHENYRQAGLTQRDDQTEMQKIQPGWRFQETQW
jgi:glucarate dehydratase